MDLSLDLAEDTIMIRIPEQLPNEPEARIGRDEEESETPPRHTDRINVFPNPFQNQFNVAWELDSDEAKLQFEVFDLTGRSIYNEQIAASRNGKHVLNLGPCNGFYILRVSENGKQLSQQKLLCVGQ